MYIQHMFILIVYIESIQKIAEFVSENTLKYTNIDPSMKRPLDLK